MHLASIPGPTEGPALDSIHESFDRCILPVLRDERPRHVLGMKEVELDTHSFVPVMQAIIEQVQRGAGALRPADVMDRIKRATRDRVSLHLSAAVSRAAWANTSTADLDADAGRPIAEAAVDALEERLESAALPLLRRVYRGASREDAESVVRAEGGPISRALASLRAALIRSCDRSESEIRDKVRRALVVQSTEARFAQMRGLEEGLTEALRAGAERMKALHAEQSQGPGADGETGQTRDSIESELSHLRASLTEYEALQREAEAQGPDPGARLRAMLAERWAGELKEGAAVLAAPGGLALVQENATRQLLHAAGVCVADISALVSSESGETDGVEEAAGGADAGPESGAGHTAPGGCDDGMPQGVASRLSLVCQVLLSSGLDPKTPHGAAGLPGDDTCDRLAASITDTKEVGKSAESVRKDLDRFSLRIQSFIDSTQRRIKDRKEYLHEMEHVLEAEARAYEMERAIKKRENMKKEAIMQQEAIQRERQRMECEIARLRARVQHAAVRASGGGPNKKCVVS